MRLRYHRHSLGRKVHWKVKSLFNSTYSSDNDSDDEPRDEYSQFAADLAADLRRMKVALPSRAQNKRPGNPKQKESRISEWSQNLYGPLRQHSDLDSEATDSTLVATGSTLGVTEFTLFPLETPYNRTTYHELYCPLPGIEYSPTWTLKDLDAQPEQKPTPAQCHKDLRGQEHGISSGRPDPLKSSQQSAHVVSPKALPGSPCISASTRSSSRNMPSDYSLENCGTFSRTVPDVKDTVPSRTWSFNSGLADVLDLHPLAIKTDSEMEDKKRDSEPPTSSPLRGSGVIRRYRGFNRNGRLEPIRHNHVGPTVQPFEALTKPNTRKSTLENPSNPLSLAELQGESSYAEVSVGPTIQQCEELEQLNIWKSALNQTESIFTVAELPGDDYCARASVDDTSTLFWSAAPSPTKQNFGDSDRRFRYRSLRQYGNTPISPAIPPLKFVPSAGIPYRIHQTALRPRLASLTAPPIHRYEKKSESEIHGHFDGIPNFKEDILSAVRKLYAELVPLSNVTLDNVQTTSGASSERRSSSSNSHNSSGKSTNGPHGNTPGSNQRNKRRKIDNRNDDQEEVSGSDSQQRRKRNDVPDPHGNPQTRRLKCPYYQRRPEECRLASCRGQGFTEMAKLKDHLKRVHVQPLRCTRCWEEVQTYDQHFRQDVICAKREEPYDRRISPLKLQEIRFNRAPFTKDQSVEEKWAILYRILFPDAEVVPSPYEQNDIGTQMEKLLVMSLEEEIAKELGDVLGNIIHVIRQRLPGIVARCRNKARRLSEESLQDLSTSPPTPTTISNSGAESIFDKSSGLGPSSTTLDTDAEIPVFPQDVWIEPNDTSNLLDCNESMDCLAGPSNEFGAAREWEEEDSWESIFQFSNS